MRNFLCFFAAVSLLFNALAIRADVAPGVVGPPGDVVTGVAVVVGDSVITLGEIKAKIAENSLALQNQYGDDPPRLQMESKKLADSIIEALVEEKLILHEFAAGQYNTNALDAVIKDYIDDIIRRTYYGDRARLIASLHQQGVTFEAWERIQREIFIIDALKHENASDPHKILISPLKVEQYYDSHKDEFKVEDQVKVRMIVLTNSSDGISARKLGEEILTKLDAGAPFAELASIYSAGSQRAKGGDYGWVNNTHFKPSLSTVAFSLKPGQHSGVIEEPEACYLLMVEDVKQAHIKTLMEVRDDITHTLLSKENARLYELWIERLKRKTSVRFY